MKLQKLETEMWNSKLLKNERSQNDIYIYCTSTVYIYTILYRLFLSISEIQNDSKTYTQQVKYDCLVCNVNVMR